MALELLFLLCDPQLCPLRASVLSVSRRQGWHDKKKPFLGSPCGPSRTLVVEIRLDPGLQQVLLQSPAMSVSLSCVSRAPECCPLQLPGAHLAHLRIVLCLHLPWSCEKTLEI